MGTFMKMGIVQSARSSYHESSHGRTKSSQSIVSKDIMATQHTTHDCTSNTKGSHILPRHPQSRNRRTRFECITIKPFSAALKTVRTTVRRCQIVHIGQWRRHVYELYLALSLRVVFIHATQQHLFECFLLRLVLVIALHALLVFPFTKPARLRLCENATSTLVWKAVFITWVFARGKAKEKHDLFVSCRSISPRVICVDHLTDVVLVVIGVCWQRPQVCRSKPEFLRRAFEPNKRTDMSHAVSDAIYRLNQSVMLSDRTRDQFVECVMGAGGRYHAFFRHDSFSRV